jgi:hypothetical protein
MVWGCGLDLPESEGPVAVSCKNGDKFRVSQNAGKCLPSFSGRNAIWSHFSYSVLDYDAMQTDTKFSTQNMEAISYCSSL